MAINTAGQTRTGNAPPVGQAQFKTGKVVLDATAIVATDYLLFELGFTPKKVNIVNLTDRVSGEWFEGMAANTCLKTAAAGTRTLESANGGITICDAEGNAATDGKCFKVLQNATLAIVLASKTLYFEAQG